ncbi:class I SAM-dependent methyltransferase [Streptomyces lancefieldiae]|uniref:Class I SAM-dependent methyltransferase n=1 Tax=Streptomyces lancefieldiae TaxID=3075520 RepID=A0ABU3B0B6_9ACTN|nr:class I SAM-dependent methyltransferase [Streptomyces sp. DSM 40712]MDT0615881.1 class I SAM-dependent methyltransferase [Streptomyces sp. DSM 40712]
MTNPTADLWHHYGRTRHATDRTVPDRFSWSWGQDSGPAAEVLGDITERCVGDLGAGAARHAAHLAVHHQPARIVAVDASPAQHAMAADLYGHLASRLSLVHSDVTRHLHAMPDTFDVLYSVFGAVDFAEPRALLPAAAAALRPGGRLVFSTLAHHLGGEPARTCSTPRSAPGPRTARRPPCTAGYFRSRCGPSSSTRPASPGSAPRRCPEGPDRAPQTRFW